MQLELVGITENDAGEGSATTGVMKDFLYDASNVSMALGIVERSVLRGALSEASVRRCKVLE
jgi:hypothetical protein